MKARTALPSPSVAAATIALALLGWASWATPTLAQGAAAPPDVTTVLPHSWNDQSGSLPGTEMSTALLVVGAVAVAAVAYFVFRSDGAENEEGEDQAERSASHTPEPDRRVPTIFLDLDRNGSPTALPTRWSVGVAWRF
jgi:hypothetical protein